MRGELPLKKLSVNEDSPYYDMATAMQIGKVFLNGARVEGCIAYNQCEGWVEAYKRENGRVVIVDEALVVERLKGVVSVEWKSDK